MAQVRKCYREDCNCNVEGAYCDATEIMIGTYGDCLTYSKKNTTNTDEEVSDE